MKTLILNLFLLFVICNYSNAQFQEFPTPSGNALYSGCTEYYHQMLWVCGANAAIYKTRMYTYNWLSANNGLSSTLTMVTIEALDTLRVFVGGNSASASYIYKTTNSGNNWTQVFTQPNGRINAIWMRDSTRGFAEGNPINGRWSLWRTTNGGNSWDSTGRYLPSSGNETGYNNSLWCVGDTILIGTNNSRIYFSSNYGLNWSIQSTALEVNTFAIHYSFNSYPNAVWSSGSSSVQSTTNFGSNWTQYQTLPGTGNILGLCEPNCGVLNSPNSYPPYIFYTRGSQVYADDPQNGWLLFYTAPSGGNYTMLFKKRNEPPPKPDCLGTPLVGIRDNGGVSLCECILGEVRNLNNLIPEKYSLAQNYPNPFNPSTNINFALPYKSFVKIVIGNVLGQEVAVLVNEELNAGNYNVDWDASNFPSGVYFYKLEADDFVQSKKMILIK